MTKQQAYRQGVYVALVLAVLTIVEAVLAIYLHYSSSSLFLIISLIKSALVVNYFMHVYRLWREEGH
ncbi:MAG: hypothetical protein KDE04_13320 [Anaerolineales bacterium]|nr:hypothetical protein [Anaerolineales bacterium]MCB8961093.1 hypothetical protein [Ardenticatenales bacterium]